jgi:hypothetical protein
MYNRDGSPRSSWYDPLGFAGLDKVPPPPDALRLLKKNCAEITKRQKALNNLIPDKVGELQALGVKLKSMEGNPHLAKQYAALGRKMAPLTDEVHNLRREYSENNAMLESLTERIKREKSGVRDNPRAHVQHLIMPVKTARMRFDRAAEWWAAVSLSLLLFAVVGLLLFAHQFVVAGLAIIILLFIVTESVLRGAFIQTVSQLTGLLAIIGAVILFLHFWFWILMIALLGTAVFLMFQRLRELVG